MTPLKKRSGMALFFVILIVVVLSTMAALLIAMTESGEKKKIAARQIAPYVTTLSKGCLERWHEYASALRVWRAATEQGNFIPESVAATSGTGKEMTSAKSLAMAEEAESALPTDGEVMTDKDLMEKYAPDLAWQQKKRSAIIREASISFFLKEPFVVQFANAGSKFSITSVAIPPVVTIGDPSSGMMGTTVTLYRQIDMVLRIVLIGDARAKISIETFRRALQEEINAIGGVESWEFKDNEILVRLALRVDMYGANVTY